MDMRIQLGCLMASERWGWGEERKDSSGVGEEGSHRF